MTDTPNIETEAQAVDGRRGPGRPPIDQAVVTRVRTIAENDQGASKAEIWRLVVRSYEDEGRPELAPGESTVRRILKRHEHSEPIEREQFRYVSWPETFASGALPWESASVLLPEVKLMLKFGSRPSVRWGRWFWRLAQALPDGSTDVVRVPAHRDLVSSLAGVMAALEISGSDPERTWRQVEEQLMDPDRDWPALGVVSFDRDLDIAVLREFAPIFSGEQAKLAIDRARSAPLMRRPSAAD